MGWFEMDSDRTFKLHAEGVPEEVRVVCALRGHKWRRTSWDTLFTDYEWYKCLECGRQEALTVTPLWIP